MLIAPVTGDKIVTLSYQDVLRVSSYTSLKSEPAVYLKEALPDGSRAIYLSDIVEVNGVRVEYESGSKLLKALGPLRRKFNLPQEGDTVVTKLIETTFKQEEVSFEVTSLRLHERGQSTKSLSVKGKDISITLNEIIDIKRKIGGEPFKRTAFLAYYSDYLPFTTA